VRSVMTKRILMAPSTSCGPWAASSPTLSLKGMSGGETAFVGCCASTPPERSIHPTRRNMRSRKDERKNRMLFAAERLHERIRKRDRDDRGVGRGGLIGFRQSGEQCHALGRAADEETLFVIAN